MEKRLGTRKLLDGNKRQCLGPGPGNDLDVPLKTQSIKAEMELHPTKMLLHGNENNQ